MDLNEGVVDGDDVDVIVLNSISEHDTADTTETVDADFDGSHDSARLLEWRDLAAASRAPNRAWSQAWSGADKDMERTDEDGTGAGYLHGSC